MTMRNIDPYAIECAVLSLINNSELTLLMRLWIHSQATVGWSTEISAPAQIDMGSKQVTINPQLVGAMVADVMQRAQPAALEAFRTDRYSTLESTLVTMTGEYLLLHEIGHHRYSPTVDMLTAVLANTPVPQGLSAFCSNVVEDSFIQVEFQKDFPGSEYRRIWRYGQLYYDGDLEGYEKTLKDPQVMSQDPVYRMLYYFILRAYNELEPKVIRLFDSPVLPWQPDTLAVFDQAQHTVDTTTRLKTTMRFAELVMRDLKQSPEVQQALQQQEQQGQGQGPGQGQGQDRGQGSGQGAQSNGGSAGQNGRAAPQNQQSGQAQGQSGSKSKQSSGGGAGAGNLDEAVNQATEQLNRQLGETNQPRQNRTDANKAALQRRAKTHNASIGAQAMGIRRKELPNEYAELSSKAMALYEDCSIQWAKLFNQSDYTIHGLDEGEVDPALVTEWFTEKNHRIFCQDVRVRQGKNIQVIFILDHSGSMGGYRLGSRFSLCANTLAAMCHAFDEAKIQSTIFDFGTHVCLVKTSDETPELNGRSSNVLRALQDSGSGGGTDPSRAWEAIREDPAFAGEDEKVVFFLTDGEMGSASIEKTVQQTIEELTERGHWLVVSIGIDFSEQETANLARFTAPGIVKAYTTDELSSKLGEDIFDLITEFITA